MIQVGKIIADQCIIIEIPKEDVEGLLGDLGAAMELIEQYDQREQLPLLCALETSLRKVIEGEE